MAEEISTRESYPAMTSEQLPTTSAPCPEQSPPPIRKMKAPKVCGVCGDKAKSYHFGGISCDSCKAFFRRSAQNDACKNFQCPYEAKCVISVSSRKCCQYCRFQKCLSIGMEKSWVMSEDERTQMLKTRIEKKQKMQENERKQNLEKRRLVPYEPDIDEMQKYLTNEETETIKNIVFKYEKAYIDIPYNKTLADFNVGRPNVQIINMFTTIIRRFAHFLRMADDFAQLSQEDQLILLRGGILEMCLIRGALCFDQKNNCWPHANWEIYKDAPRLRIEDMRKLVSADLYDMHLKFISSIQELNPDEASLMLLLLIVVFSPERPGLQEVQHVSTTQEKYILLLRKYMDWRYGTYNSSILYPKLLTKLTDLRELNDSHTEYNLRLAKQEVEEIQSQLGNLNLNPYTQWDVMNAPPSSKMMSASGMLSSNGSSSMKQSFSQLSPGTHITESVSANNTAKLIKEMTPEKGQCQEGLSKCMQMGFMQMMQKSIMQILSSPNGGASESAQDEAMLYPQYISNMGVGSIGSSPNASQIQSTNRDGDDPPSVPSLYTEAQPDTQAEVFTSHKPEDQATQEYQQQQHYQRRDVHLAYPTRSPEPTYQSEDMNVPQYSIRTQAFHPQFNSRQTQVTQSQYISTSEELPTQYKITDHESQHAHLQEQQRQYQERCQGAPHDSVGQGVLIGSAEDLQPPLVHLHQESPPTVQPSILQMAGMTHEEKGNVHGNEEHSSQMDSLDLGQLEQFKIVLEQLASCDNSQQIEQIKQILGPDLVSQFQQKLIGQNINPSVTQTEVVSEPSYPGPSTALPYVSPGYMQFSHNVSPQIQPIHSHHLVTDQPSVSSLSPPDYIRLGPDSEYRSELSPHFQHYSYTQHLLGELDNPQENPVSSITNIISQQYEQE